jgi:hypothetical protein
MNRGGNTCWTLIIVASLVFATCSPKSAWAFLDEDSLKTSAIITGISLGVALLIVLIAGTIRDIKGDDDEDIWEDNWTDNSLLKLTGSSETLRKLLGKQPPLSHPPIRVMKATWYPSGEPAKGTRLPAGPGNTPILFPDSPFEGQSEQGSVRLAQGNPSLFRGGFPGLDAFGVD